MQGSVFMRWARLVGEERPLLRAGTHGETGVNVAIKVVEKAGVTRFEA